MEKEIKLKLSELSKSEASLSDLIESIHDLYVHAHRKVSCSSADVIEGMSAYPFTINDFDQMYGIYYEYFHRFLPFGVLWMGSMSMQWPTDLLMYQEILVETRPDVVIEVGVASGVTCRFLHDIFTLMKIKNLINTWKIIGVDINPCSELNDAPNEIEFIQMNSLDAVNEIKQRIPTDAKVMVMIDSCHEAHHTFNEMKLYGALVSTGCYMIVEDGCLDYLSKNKRGPLGAIEKYLAEFDDFAVDFKSQRWVTTQNYNGYLRKKEK